jgi:Domain of Unknown Function with PDB structure (DUF3858)/Transglutaminase-like superfamily
MKVKKFRLLVICLIFCALSAQSQEKTIYKFGKMSPEDFGVNAPKFDSGANAVILEDIGSTRFDGNNKGFFNLVFTRFIRVKIINKSGFDIANYELNLYHYGDGYEKLYSIKGSTFNLEKGLVTETKLDDKSIYSEKYGKNHDIKKFSMPALKEGSIYDLEYTIKSPFGERLRPWAFQGEYPCLWSEYEVILPPPFHYLIRVQGDQHFDVNETKAVFGSFAIKFENGTNRSDDYRMSGNSIQQRWVRKNVPSIHEEAFITSLENYKSRVAFQLNYFQWKTDTYTGDRIDYMETWNKTSKTLLRDEDFGIALSYENDWMKDDLKEISQGASSNEEKARLIYNYVRDNFKAADKEGYRKETIYTQNSLKEVFKQKRGNVAEINLLLTSMLRHEDIHADPLILSTRDHAISNPSYPLIDDYDYVVCVAYLDNKIITLDATKPYNGFGQLPVECYNGWGQVMNEEKSVPMEFSPDSISEIRSTSVFINNDEKGKPSGSIKIMFGKSGSYDRRVEIKNSSEKVYEQKIRNSNESDMVIGNFGIDSLNKCDFPLTIHYDFELKNLSSGDILYFNPILNEGFKTNPFKSMERHYPVEIPYRIDETYLLTMDIPAGYQVEELPKSARVAYNDKEGMFEYLIQKGESQLQMRVHLKLNKAFFPVEEYQTLRDFFAYVVKKESEQVVFKKTH